MKVLLSSVALWAILGSSLGFALTPIKFLPTKMASNALVPQDKIMKNLREAFPSNDYREIRVQVILNENHEPDHLLVTLHSKKFHKFELVSVAVNSAFDFLSVQNNYEMRAMDQAQQPGIDVADAKCPDTTAEFIAICPNDDTFEQGITEQAATAAKGKNLKVIRLDHKTGTKAAWLNYMACPNLRGNFYDGDSNPTSIVVADGIMSSSEVQAALKGQFKYNVTNVWVACEAYNDPFKSVMLDDLQAKKFGAGINDLAVGPSDKAAACAIEQFVAGQPMTDAFQKCRDQFENTTDQWGFGGNGTDQF